MKSGLLQAGTGVPCHMTLSLRMTQFPVPIERLEKEFGQPAVEGGYKLILKDLVRRG